MMKKIALLLLLIVLINPLFALDTSLRFITKNITIQGAFGEVAKIAVETIPAMASGFMHGMPFNIEEPYVLAGKGEGRQIANWSFITNSNFKIEIEAEPMKIDDGRDVVPLTYILKFSTTPSYVNANGNSISNAEYYFTVKSQTNSADKSVTTWDPFANIERAANSYIGAVNGTIYFQFDENSTNRILDTANYHINSDALPSGSYSANVTLRMFTKD